MNEQLICWIDIETTSIRPDDGDILELAAILTTFDLDERSRFERVLEWSGDPASLPPDALRMHSESGLLDLCRGPDAVPLAECDADLWRWLAAGRAGCPPPWAGGSNVGSFDLRWIEAKMPLVAALLHYRTIDTRTLAAAFSAWGGVHIEPPASEQRHRAMADIEASLEAARTARATLETLVRGRT